MTIRDFRPATCLADCTFDHSHGVSDVPRLRELFRQQNFGYQEPDWSRMEGKVLVDESDVIRTFELSRKTCEMYVVTDESAWATPGIKAENFRRLDRAAITDLRAKGYQDRHAWIPPRCKAFVRRLLREMGWVRTDGNDFVPLMQWFGF